LLHQAVQFELSQSLAALWKEREFPNSKRVVRSNAAGQFRVSSPHRLPNLDEVVVGEEKWMLDDKIQQLSGIHTTDLADNVFLIAHTKMHRRSPQE
jgi:hypothetical protein